ncbi:MAG: UvrD-helicase domain-containing protein [Planctomycetota bacterium]
MPPHPFLSLDKPHRLIRASAGAGKTYQLTQHLLRLLRRGAPVGSVLATTFTRKAAGEILDRLIRRLLAEAAGRELPGELMRPGFKDAATLLDEVADTLHRVGVTTIDGFFHRLAQGFRFELDLPAMPRLIDEGGAEAAALRAEAIEAVLAEASADDAAFRALLDLMRRLHHDAATRGVASAIDRIVTQHAEVYRGAPDAAAWDALDPAGLLSGAERAAAAAAWDAMEAQLPTTAKGEPNKRWLRAWQDVRRDVATENWDKLLSTGLVAKVFLGENNYYGPMPEAWVAACRPWADHARGVLIERIARQTRATHELMRRFDGAYARLRAQRGVMHYADLSHRLAGGLFVGPGDTPRSVDDATRQEVYFRLDTRVTHLLLDEFQDTSLEQWDVLRPFVDEIGAAGDGSRSLFVVGDPKQAIYGWRGGCVELFDAVPNSAPLIEFASLAESYRSSPVVLDAVNTVFSGLGGCDAFDPQTRPIDAAAAAAWGERFEPHVSAKPELRGHVVLESSPLAEPAADDDPPEEAGDDGWTLDPHDRFCAERIAALHETVAASGGGRTIGVLTRGNAAAARLLHELRRLGLPASGEGGASPADDPGVSAVLSALWLADHPGDTASAFHVLNAPLGAVVGLDATADRERVAASIRAAVLRDGLAGTLAGWVAALAGDCDAAGLTKLTRLVELAEAYAAEGSGDPADRVRPGRFVDHVEAARVEEPTADAVRVMTIHRSKGLEFDAVVLPELDGRFNNTIDPLIDRPDPTGPIHAVFRGVRKEHRAADPQLESAYAEQRYRLRQEDLCTLYVAMTRARHALHLLVRPGVDAEGKPRRVGSCFASLLRDTLGDPGDGAVTRGDPAWCGPPEATPTPAPITPPVRRLSLHDGKPRHRPTVAPSRLHAGGRVEAKQLLRLTPSEAAARGDAVHAALARIEWLGDALPSEAADVLRDVLTKDAVRAALRRPELDGGQTAEVWRERPFVAADGPRLLRGVFDRVTVVRGAAGGAVSARLVDFKTDDVPGRGPRLAERAEIYAPQLAAYRRALSVMLGLGEGAVSAELVFTTPGVGVA